MKLHIIDNLETKPETGSEVTTNCDQVIPFVSTNGPVYWDDGRVCQTCLENHRAKGSLTHKTFVSVEATF